MRRVNEERFVDRSTSHSQGRDTCGAWPADVHCAWLPACETSPDQVPSRVFRATRPAANEMRRDDDDGPRSRALRWNYQGGLPVKSGLQRLFRRGDI